MNLKKFNTIATNGLLRYNPIFRLVLGTCPTLALSTSVISGLGMGVAVVFILTFSNILISLLRKVIPSEVRIPAYVLIIATLVTIIRMVLEKYVPSVYESMGVYLPLIVVNCIILGRAEGFASKNPVIDSAVDGIFTGLGFTFAIVLMGTVRELLGAGSFMGIKLWNFRIEFFTSSAGAFFVYAMFIALFNSVYQAVENNIHKKSFEKTMAQLDAPAVKEAE